MRTCVDDEAWWSDPAAGGLLARLLAFDTPSGDEDILADWLSDWAGDTVAGSERKRLGASLVVIRGKPRTAIFAHTDTTGYTLAYGGALVRIGGPYPKPEDLFWMVGDRSMVSGVRAGDEPGEMYLTRDDAAPGSRWVYAAQPVIEDGEVHSPYLDNRGGVWAALQTLQRCEDVAIAFTSGEEHNSVGALVCAKYLFERYGIENALISDLTWDTDHIHCGEGVAISLRDQNVPRQRYLNRVLEIAQSSGIAFQREIESSGGSDAMGIQRSGVPMDWLFVGAPEREPHTSRESVRISDLESMVDMLTVLVERL